MQHIRVEIFTYEHIVIMGFSSSGSLAFLSLVLHRRNCLFTHPRHKKKKKKIQPHHSILDLDLTLINFNGFFTIDVFKSQFNCKWNRPTDKIIITCGWDYKPRSAASTDIHPNKIPRHKHTSVQSFTTPPNSLSASAQFN